MLTARDLTRCVNIRAANNHSLAFGNIGNGASGKIYKNAERSARPRSPKEIEYSCANERPAKSRQEELSQRINLHRMAEQPGLDG
jgi:hypothetical protein